LETPKLSSLVESAVAKRDSINAIRGGSISYKPELDGLRAIAVGVVVAFHFEKFKAGFLGVDVFFVLSGYLITRVLIANFAKDKLFSTFYKKRYFRLFPILLANVLVSSLVLLYIDHKFYGEYALRTIFYLRNIYWSTTQGHDLWLHTWSLSAEEQFYLAYPVILFFCWKKIRNKKYVAFLFLTYFILCQLINQTHYEFSGIGIFNWSILTRPSGLALGCALGVVSQLKISAKPSYLYLLYVLIALTGVVAVDSRSTFWADVMTACVILSFEPFLQGGSRNAFRKLLAAKPLPYLGRLSYSIYMWHPIVIFVVFHLWRQPSVLRGATAVLATLLVSGLSFHLIELPATGYLVGRFCQSRQKQEG
jgi:hypothetical protein